MPLNTDIPGIQTLFGSFMDHLRVDSDVISAAFQNIIGGVESLNSKFTQGRQRVTEMSAAIADATPMVDRLGGSIGDTMEVIEAVSEATRRNVIATTEEVSKLYAAGQLAGVQVNNLVGSFQDVGVQFSQVGDQMENSIRYVQSVGGNARQIMSQVNYYMENMNKYNFQEGVVGLTKMVTQAQLLRFDMQQTMNLADKAMSPEGAIELASAFQRLGVSAGDLTDPFQLMYKSLNDPQGLQNSIVEMTKQFTYFDEKTKTFKINPQGILTLKEIESQTGLSSREMSKLALNVADVERKISQITPSFQFENEEDKMYIANIAKLGKGGQYEITVKEDGKDRTIPLQEATNQQLQELLNAQKSGPKTIEDIQRAQLNALDVLHGDLDGIRDSLVLGAVSSRNITEILTGREVRGAVLDRTRALSEIPSPKKTRESVDQALDKIGDLISRAKRGDNVKDMFGEVLGDATSSLKNMPQVLGNLLKDVEKAIDIPGMDEYKKILGDKIDDVKQSKLGQKIEGAFDGATSYIPKITNLDSQNLFASNLEIKNMPDLDKIAAGTKSTIELIQTMNNNDSFVKNETKKVIHEFGEIAPMKLIVEPGPGFKGTDIAIFKSNLEKPEVMEPLTIAMSKMLQNMQTKET